jgi:endonuclease YncB( thermonuclease family)
VHTKPFRRLGGVVLVATAFSLIALDSASAVATRTARIGSIVDGDTLALTTGEQIRLIGIDAPETPTCEGHAATATMRSLVARGTKVRLTFAARTRKDKYGRLLAYVDAPSGDLGLRMIKSGHAKAKYDSRDGYGFHPRQRTYVASDKAVRDHRCSATPTTQPPSPRGGTCDPSYPTVCIPPPPPDLDCGDIPYRRFTVYQPDPHRFDGDGDGIGCESN